jgi:hypothetical protein
MKPVGCVLARYVTDPTFFDPASGLRCLGEYPVRVRTAPKDQYASRMLP